MSIAGGFFGKLSENIDNQRDYIRARVDEDRKYLRGQGLKRQSGIQKQRGQYEQAANELIRRGASKDKVLGLLQMDPKGLLQVHSTGYSGAELEASFSLHEDYKGEATMSEILAKIVPAIQSMPKGSNPEKVKRRSLGAFLGLDLDTELNEQVYNQQIVDGMSGDDILATVGTPISAIGSNPSGVSYDLSRDSGLSSPKRSGLLKTANNEYGNEDIKTKLGEIDALVAGPNETPEQLEARKDSVVAEINEFRDSKDAKRLTLAVRLFGIKPETASMFTEYGPKLFNSFNGFTAAYLDEFTLAFDKLSPKKPKDSDEKPKDSDEKPKDSEGGGLGQRPKVRPDSTDTSTPSDGIATPVEDDGEDAESFESINNQAVEFFKENPDEEVYSASVAGNTIQVTKDMIEAKPVTDFAKLLTSSTATAEYGSILDFIDSQEDEEMKPKLVSMAIGRISKMGPTQEVIAVLKSLKEMRK